MASGNRNIYRKSALDRLSSPDQLDKPITIVPAGLIFAIAGAVIASGLTIAWSIYGRIPVTIQTDGIYTYGEGVNSIYAANSGVVSDVYLENGDEVQEGDLIAELENDEIEDRIAYINKRKDMVDAVTIDSTDDQGSADNKQMLDIKSQLLTVDNDKDSADLMLEEKQKEMADATDRTDAARDAMEAARDAYYASLNEGSTAEEQLKMQDAKDDVSNARNKLTMAKNDYENAKNDIATAKNDVSLAKNDVSAAKGDIDRATNAVQSAKSDVSTAKSDLDKVKSDMQTSKNDIETAKNDLTTAKNNLGTVNNEIATAQSELDAIKNQKEIAEQNVKNLESDLVSALQQYNDFLRGKSYVQDFDPNNPTQYESSKYKGEFDADSNFATQKAAYINKLTVYNEQIDQILERMNSVKGDDDGTTFIRRWRWNADTDDVVEDAKSSFKAKKNQGVAEQGSDFTELTQLIQSSNEAGLQIKELKKNKEKLTNAISQLASRIQTEKDEIAKQSYDDKIEYAQNKLNEAKGKTENAEKQVDQATAAVDTAQDKYDQQKYELQLLEARQKIATEEHEVVEKEQEKSDAKEDMYQDLAKVYSSENAVAEAKKRAEDVYSQISVANSAINDALNQYYDKEDAYLDAELQQLAIHADATIDSDTYNNALNDYRTDLQQQRSIDDALVELRSKAISNGIATQTQRELIGIQFENAKASALAQIDKDLKEQEANLRNTEIRATRDGILTDLHITQGSSVQAGATVANVKAEPGQFADLDADVVISYVPVSEGKKIKDGMEVKVYPSTADRNEYGHMRGIVRDVASYVTSKDDMQNELGDSTLVDSFTKNGPVIAVTIELERDPSTVSGYYWSNSKGRNLTIQAGTTVSMDTVVEDKAPIKMLIPYLRDRFDNLSTVEQSSDQQNNGEQNTNNG